MTSRIRRASGYLFAAGLVAISAGRAIAQSADGSLPGAGRFMPREGELIYRTSCQACHMPGGQGAIGAGAYPSLAANSKLRAARFPALVVVNGARAMPPFRALLDDEQIAAVVNYVRSHFGNDYKDHLTAADVRSVRR